MGSPTTLSNFIQWAKSKYPADRYALVLWNHGGGWRDRSTNLNPLSRAICWDEGNSDDCLYVKEVRSALSSGGVKFDLIGMDACLMGHVEVAYEFKDYFTSDGVMVGSQETEPGDGWPYTSILSWLKSNASATPEALGNQIVTAYKNWYSGKDSTYTLACSRASKLAALVNLLNAFADSLNDNSELTAITNARTNCKAYSESDGYYGLDIYRFADQVYNNVSNTSIKSAASNLKGAVLATVASTVYGSGRNDTAKYGSKGLCVYFPKSSSYFDSAYTTEILFGSNSVNKWDDFLKRYYAKNLGGGGGSSTSVDGSGTATLSKKGVAPNTYYTSVTLTVKPTSVGGLGGGSAKVVIPSGWTTPQNSASTGQGYVKAWIYKYQTTSYKLTTSVSGNEVTITGIPSNRLSYGSGDQLKLGYYKYTTPSTQKAYTFDVYTAGAGGTLTKIASSPSINVNTSYSAAAYDDEVEDEDGGLKAASLGQNYPNPFNPATTFSYFVPQGGHVVIKLYNVAGEMVDTIVDEDKQAGEYTIRYDAGERLSRGVYFYKMWVDGVEVGTKKAVVLK